MKVFQYTHKNGNDFQKRGKNIMARITLEFFSEVLTKHTTITVVLPEKSALKSKDLPTLYLLHGFSDDHTMWTRQTGIERYATDKGLAVVMPDVDHSFYTDMTYGKNYWTFLTEELPKMVRSLLPLSDRREDNFVAGLSMGGYGAFKWLLNKPEDFAAGASLSGVLELAKHNQEHGGENPMDEVVFNSFGGNKLTGTMHDIFHLAKQVDQSDGPKPKLYHACGTEDFLFDQNKHFKELTEELSLEVKTIFDPGAHEWNYWDHHIKKVIDWLPIESN